MRAPNFSSAGAFGSAAGGFDVVNPPRFGFGKIALFEAAVPAVVLCVVTLFKLDMNGSPVTGASVPCSLTVYLFDSSSLLLAVICSPSPVDHVYEPPKPKVPASETIVFSVVTPTPNGEI